MSDFPEPPTVLGGESPPALAMPADVPRVMRFLERALRLQRGDLGRGLLLFAYLFLVITAYVIGKAARDALFLDRFAAIQLPYADIAIAILVGFVVAAYVRIGRTAMLRDLLAGSLVFLALNAAAFWWFARFHSGAWVFPLLYVWVGIFGVLAPMQVWTLANYVLTMREAKRLFGLVGGGAIAGWIFGGFFTKHFVQYFKTEDLLLAVGVLLLLCAALVGAIWKRRSTRSEASGILLQQSAERPASVLRSMGLVRSSSYLRAVAAVICISSFVTTIAGWQFKAVAKQFLHDKEALAAFFGSFNLYGGLLGLTFQLFFTARLLRKFGIGPALFLVPTILAVGSVGMLVWPTLLMAVALKGGDQVLRYSIDKSTVELLYLPVAADIKLQVKSFVDTVIWRMGDGFAGLTLLLFSGVLALGDHPGRAAWINVGLLVFWLAAAAVARRQYVDTLSDSIRRHRLDAERDAAPVLDRSTAALLTDRLQSDDPAEILYALDLLHAGDARAAHPAVRGLLRHPESAVRREAIRILDASRDRAAVPDMEALLTDPDVQVRTEALLFLAHHAKIDPLSRIEALGDFPDFSIRSGMVAFLAHPGEAQNIYAARVILQAMVKDRGPEGRAHRLEAARLLGELPEGFDGELRQLLEDPDPEVARAAARAAADLGNRRHVRPLIDLLENPQVAADAAGALARFGERILGTLADHLGDRTVPTRIRQEISGVLARIGGQAAARILADNLLQGDTALRFRVLTALGDVRRAHPEVEIDPLAIETVLAGEIVGHYRSYQILGALGKDLRGDPSIAHALRESMGQEVERIFGLLGLLYPRFDLHSAYVGLRSTDGVVHDNALEFLDNVLKPQIRDLVVPLLDGEVSIEERVRRADRVVGVKLEAPDKAAAVLVSCGDPWLKSCGAYAIGLLGLKALEGKLDECLDHPDPLLRETARQAKQRLTLAPGEEPAG